MNNPQEYDPQYMPGLENRAIRYYFYLTKGLDILNLFRNLFLAIIALYIAMKLDNWLLLAAMFIPSILLLTIVGYYSVHRVNKVSEWLGIRFSTHYAMNQYNLQQGIYDTLQEIKEALKKL